MVLKREEYFVKVDEKSKSMLLEMKHSSDLLYMYPSKERHSIIPTQIENCFKISSIARNRFPEKFNSYRPIDKFEKRHSFGGDIFKQQ